MPIVADHMSSNVLIVAPDSNVADAARRMAERSVGAVLVLDGTRLLGIFTERDVLKVVAAGLEAAGAMTVSALMTRYPETIESTETTEHAASLMVHGGFRHLPVVDGG
ncbi:MAG: CBS domain-containing protein, partial [Actinobacteria bacterium]|nr:CBS domain-containing protein [Actinomycetota bacterium]